MNFRNLFTRTTDGLSEKGFTHDFRGLNAVTCSWSTDESVDEMLQLKKFAKEQGMDVVAVFHDSVKKATAERPMLKECIDYCAEYKINALVASNLSGLGENLYAIARNYDRLMQIGTNIFFVQEHYHTLYRNGKPLPETNVLTTFIGSLGSLYVEEKPDRVDMGEEWNRYAKTEKRKKREEKYKEVIDLLREGYHPKDVVELCKADGFKVSVSTVWSLKRDFVDFAGLFENE